MTREEVGGQGANPIAFAPSMTGPVKGLVRMRPIACKQSWTGRQMRQPPQSFRLIPPPRASGMRGNKQCCRSAVMI